MKPKERRLPRDAPDYCEAAILGVSKPLNDSAANEVTTIVRSLEPVGMFRWDQPLHSRTLQPQRTPSKSAGLISWQDVPRMLTPFAGIELA